MSNLEKKTSVGEGLCQLWTLLEMLFDPPCVFSDAQIAGVIKEKARILYKSFLEWPTLPFTHIQLLINEVLWKGHPIKSLSE